MTCFCVISSSLQFSWSPNFRTDRFLKGVRTDSETNRLNLQKHARWNQSPLRFWTFKDFETLTGRTGESVSSSAGPSGWIQAPGRVRVHFVRRRLLGGLAESPFSLSSLLFAVWGEEETPPPGGGGHNTTEGCAKKTCGSPFNPQQKRHTCVTSNPVEGCAGNILQSEFNKTFTSFLLKY